MSSRYNLRVRKVINYNEEDIDDKVDLMNDLKSKLILNDDLEDEAKVVNSVECISLAMQLIIQYNMDERFVYVVKKRLRNF